MTQAGLTKNSNHWTSWRTVHERTSSVQSVLVAKVIELRYP